MAASAAAAAGPTWVVAAVVDTEGAVAAATGLVVAAGARPMPGRTSRAGLAGVAVVQARARTVQ
jgi:hypothetical protein